jgi:hypothetical protein
MPKEGLSFGAINKILDKTRQTQRKPPKPVHEPKENHTIENPKLKKQCSECHETKDIHLFNISETGKRHKPYCKKCEALLINPKKMGTVIEKGNVKEQEVTIKELKEEIKVNEERQKKNRKKRKLKPKPQKKKVKDKMPVQKNKTGNIFTATDYFIHSVLPHTIEVKNCFTINEIKPALNLGLTGTKEHSKAYTILKELVKLNYLKVKTIRGKPNKYYIPKSEIDKLIKEKIITKTQAMQIVPVKENVPRFLQNKTKRKETPKPKPKPNENTKQLSVIYNKKIVEQIEAIAEKRQMDLSKVLRIAAAQFIENNDKYRLTDGFIELIARFAKDIAIEIKEDGKKEIGVKCKSSKDMFELYSLLPPEQQKTVRNPHKNIIIFKWG